MNDDVFTIHKDECVQADASETTVDQSQSQPVDVGTRIALSPAKINALRNASPQGKVQVSKFPAQKDAATPSTPRHQRVSVTGVLYTPKTPKTPRTPGSRATSTKSVFGDARRVFSRGADSGPIIGRQKEREELHGFIAKATGVEPGGCLYVSGPPGTGKSALVGEVCEEHRASDSATKFAYVNCMSVKRASDVYQQLNAELGISDDVFGSKAKDSLEAAIRTGNPSRPYLVVLDEIDQLLSFDLDILYTLFEWSLRPVTNLVLIGIANALDLTDRFLPRLKARNLRPGLLPFLPYTVPEIASVLSSRARSLLSDQTSDAAPSFTPFLASSAIQLISKKVAAQTGDLRKAFDLAQKSIDLVETETRQALDKHDQSQISPQRTPLGNNNNLSSPPSSQPTCISPNTPTKATPPIASPLSSYTITTAPRATIAHVLRATNLAFNSTSSTTRLKSLNLQQKAALCTMLALERRNRLLAADPQQPQSQTNSHTYFPHSLPSPLSTPTKKRCGHPGTPSKHKNSTTASSAPTIRNVYDAYRDLCKREDVLHSLSHTEFRDVIDNLETSGLVEDVAESRGGGTGKMGSTTPGTPRQRRVGGVGGVFESGGKGGGAAEGQRRIKAVVGWEEVEPTLEGVGGEVLRRMVGVF